MAQVTVRNLDDAVIARLKARARLNERSLEAEIRHILSQSAMLDRREIVRQFDEIRESLVGRYTGDPIAEIRADRNR